MHMVGARSTVDDFESYSNFDYEAFLRKTEVARGRNMSLANEEWDMIEKSGPSVSRDQKLADGR